MLAMPTAQPPLDIDRGHQTRELHRYLVGEFRLG